MLVAITFVSEHSEMLAELEMGVGILRTCVMLEAVVAFQHEIRILPLLGRLFWSWHTHGHTVPGDIPVASAARRRSANEHRCFGYVVPLEPKNVTSFV
jgi:hypothetical protein